MKIYIGRYPSNQALKKNPDATQKKSIRIDPHDTWNMAETLADIILPMLKQLKATKHGSPVSFPAFEEDSNHHWPQHCFDFYKEGDKAANARGHEQWDFALDKMIWSFEQIANDDRDAQFHSGQSQIIWTKINAAGEEVDSSWKGEYFYRMDRGPNDTHEFDKKGYKKYYEQIQEGLDLFSKHYFGLWD